MIPSEPKIFHIKCSSVRCVGERESNIADSSAIEFRCRYTCRTVILELFNFRGDFNKVAQLRVELQTLLTKRKRKIRTSSPSPPLHNVSCRFCETEPIRGYLYRCLECESVCNQFLFYSIFISSRKERRLTQKYESLIDETYPKKRLSWVKLFTKQNFTPLTNTR